MPAMPGQVKVRSSRNLQTLLAAMSNDTIALENGLAISEKLNTNLL